MPVTTSQRQSLTAAFARRFGAAAGLSFASITDTRTRATRTDGTWIEGDFTRARMRVTAVHDASVVPADAVPAMIAPAPRHLAPAAAAAIRKAYGAGGNFMTPEVEGFASVGGTFACEVSTGRGISFNRQPAPDIWGVTVATLKGAKREHKLSRMLTTRDAACRYLGKLKHLADYRAARRDLIRAVARYVAAGLEADAHGDTRTALLCETRANLVRHEMGALRNRYGATLARFGLEAYDHDAPEAEGLTLGQRHAAARMVAQPVQQAQVLDMREAQAQPRRVSFAPFSDYRRAARAGAYAWPGGYPLIATMADGSSVCPACLKRDRRDILEALRDGSRGLACHHFESLGPVYEGPAVACDSCGEYVDSAYGEPGDAVAGCLAHGGAPARLTWAPPVVTPRA